MSHLRRLRPVLRRRSGRALLVAGLLMLAGVGGGVSLAASQPLKPGIDVRVSPASQSVPRGGTATYTIWLSSTGGFAGTVTVKTSGLPAGSSAAFAPPAVTLQASGTGSSATSNLTVTTTASTPIGSKTFTITGTSGKLSGSVDAGLTVNYPLSSSIAMTATPASIVLEPGATASYAVKLTRTNLPGTVAFTVTGLPAGATASFSPNPATGDTSVLQVVTKGSTPEGDSTLYLVASGKDPGGVTRYAYAGVQLTIDKGRRPFTITGNLTGLAPGVTQPLDLTLSNPNKKALSVTNLGVTITQVTRAAGVTKPCGTADYAVMQYAGPYPVTVPANGSVSLSGLHIPASVWPKASMLNRPVNQDGCKGARLTLTYSGSGNGG